MTQFSAYTTDPVLSLKTYLAENMLMWTTLYLVKACFLALIWFIFNVSEGFRKAWWAVTVYTFLTFWPIFLSEVWQCGNPADYANPEACSSAGLWFSPLSPLYVRFALHISSDVFVLLLPVARIRKMQVSKGKKISIAAVFAITIIDIFSGIARNIIIICSFNDIGDSQALEDADRILGVIEPALAVAVCTLPVYRSLFKPRMHRNEDFEPLHNAAGTDDTRLPYKPSSAQTFDTDNWPLRTLGAVHLVPYNEQR